MLAWGAAKCMGPSASDLRFAKILLLRMTALITYGRSGDMEERNLRISSV
jgi:hypothetical protein